MTNSMTGLARVAGAVIALSTLIALPAPVLATCAGMAWAPQQNRPHPYLIRAAARPASTGDLSTGAVPAGKLRITFVGHSSFEIETPQGALIQTDYNDYIRGERAPHIVTMNNAHDTHFSFQPDKAIQHVLRGWDPAGGIARHNIHFRDVRVRNVPTNFVELGEGKLRNGNSMFVFESVGMCVVHISHLHHYLSDNQVRDLGPIDVAFAPIDGMWTMSHDELFRVLEQIRARLIIPMHFGSMGGTEAFVARAGAQWSVRRHPERWIVVDLKSLPQKPEVVFLQGF